MNLKSRKNASVNKVSSPLDTFGSAVLQVIAQDLVWGDVSQLVRVLANKCRIIMITISQVRLMAQNSHVSTSSPRSSPR